MESVRDRMVVGAAELIARAGVAEASFRNVVAHTGAPRGSIYHHFPGGKDELVGEAMRLIGGRLLGALRRTPLEGPDDVLVAFAGLFRRLYVDSQGEAGCAVAAVVSSAAPSSEPRTAAAQVFSSWRQELAALFAAAGAPPERCAGLAVVTVATVEGALVLARAAGDVAVFDAAVDELVRQVSAGLTSRRLRQAPPVGVARRIRRQPAAAGAPRCRPAAAPARPAPERAARG